MNTTEACDAADIRELTLEEVIFVSGGGDIDCRPHGHVTINADGAATCDKAN